MKTVKSFEINSMFGNEKLPVDVTSNLAIPVSFHSGWVGNCFIERCDDTPIEVGNTRLLFSIDALGSYFNENF